MWKCLSCAPLLPGALFSHSVSLQLQVCGASSAKHSSNVPWISITDRIDVETNLKAELTACLCVTITNYTHDRDTRYEREVKWDGVCRTVKAIFNSICICVRLFFLWTMRWSALEQVHMSRSNKAGLSLPTWMDVCTFNPCVGVGGGWATKAHPEPPFSTILRVCVEGNALRKKTVHTDRSKCTKRHRIQTGKSLCDLWCKSQLPTWSQSGHKAQTWRRCTGGKSLPLDLHSVALCGLFQTNLLMLLGFSMVDLTELLKAVLLGSLSPPLCFGCLACSETRWYENKDLSASRLYIPTPRTRCWCTVEPNTRWIQEFWGAGLRERFTCFDWSCMRLKFLKTSDHFQRHCSRCWYFSFLCRSSMCPVYQMEITY